MQHDEWDVPRVSSLAGSRAFSVAGPQACNQLPVAYLFVTRTVSQLSSVISKSLSTAAYGVTDN